MRRFSLHRSTVVVGGLAALTLILITVPGLQRNYEVAPVLPGLGDNFDHGWPVVYLERTVPPESFLIHGWAMAGTPWLSLRSWRFWEGGVARFSPAALVTDGAVAVALVIGAVAVWERRRRRRTHVLQVRMSELLAAMLVVAVPLGWWSYQRAAAAREEPHVRFLANDDGDQDDDWPTVMPWRYPVAPAWALRLIGPARMPQSLWRCTAVDVIPSVNDNYRRLGDAVTRMRELKALRKVSVEIPPAGVDLPLDDFAKLGRLPCLDFGDVVYPDGAKVWRLTAADVARLPRLNTLILPARSALVRGAEAALRDAMPRCRMIFVDEL